MNIPAEFTRSVAAFPPALQSLLEAELAAGNAIVELASCFPAPPVGAYIKLARPVSTRPRTSGPDIRFYDRNSSLYSGEFTDVDRRYFLLEPPHPPAPPPDMDAIRAAMQPKPLAPAPPVLEGRRKMKPSLEAPKPRSVIERFQASMDIDYEKWREGIGYDLGLLETASEEERLEIEDLLVRRGVLDWRDVEALAALDSPRASEQLRRVLGSADHRLTLALIRHAENLLSEAERTAILISALEGAEIYTGLTEALLEIESFHPRPVLDALFRGVLERDGATAGQFAAMLLYLHGKASSAFDWDHRPFFLKFQTDSPTERRALFAELCHRIDVSSEAFLAS